MKKILSNIENKYRPSTAYISNSLYNNNLNKKSNYTKAAVDETSNNKLNNVVNFDKKELHNKLSLKRINFDFSEYSVYPDEQFLPSIYFFKFLAIRPEYFDNKKLIKKPEKLKIYIPDTLVFNDTEINFWIYTDENGNVHRVDYFNDMEVLEKFKPGNNKNLLINLESYDNSTNQFNSSDYKNDNYLLEKELIAVFKSPQYGDQNQISSNHLELLNQEELEKHLFSKSSSPYVIQKYIKCRGPKAFMCRSVYKRDKLPYVYIFTNKASYTDNILNQNLKFIINTNKQDSYYVFYTNSGKHLEETSYYLNNVVKFIESNTDIIIEELVCDFVKDEAEIWWLVNCKAFKIKNLEKFIDKISLNSNETKNKIIRYPNLEKFCCRRNYDGSEYNSIKFDYQTKLKCKFCGINFNKVNLKYNLTTKMILETDKQLKYLNVNLNYIERPDLSHTDSSMLYLPYKVCEDCYLLFETMNDIKTYQIKIANYFRINVDHINFGVNYYISQHNDDYKTLGVNHKLEKQYAKENNTIDLLYNSKTENINYKNNKLYDSKSINCLYRVLIIFSDLLWEENISIPDKQLYLIFDFLNIKIKAKIKKYYKEIDYMNVNFFKIFYLACNPEDGFIDYIDKNRTMLVKLGYFNNYENKDLISNITESYKDNINKKVQSEKIKSIKTDTMYIEEKNDKLKKNIVIEDADICSSIEIANFVQFASVELSVQGLKYGEKYRNSLNGLLFREEKPHLTGKLRCIIRINQEKPVDISNMNCRKHYNFYIPPVNFVIPEELPDYWLELIERQKLRETILNKIYSTINNNIENLDKRKYKNAIFKTLESLISKYLVRDSDIT